MFQSVFLRVLKKVGLFMLQLSGLWPFSYDHQLKKFKFLWYFTIIPISIMAYPLIVILFWSKYLNKEVVIKNTVVKLLSTIFLSFNSLNFVIMFISQYLNFKGVKQFICKSLKLIDELNNELDKSEFKYGKHLLKFYIKTLLFMSILIYSIIQNMTRLTGFQGNYLLYVMSALPNIIMKIYPDVFYGGLILIGFYLTEINCKIAYVLDKAKSLSENQDFDDEKRYQKMKNFCELSDQLDRLCVLHCTIIETSGSFNRICSFQVTLWLAMGLVVFLVNMFMEYVAISSSIKAGQFVISVFLNDLLAIGLTIAEMYLTATVSDSVMNECRKTGILLNALLMRQNIDVRFKRSVEIYSGQILTSGLSITGMGLFNIDMSLMYSLVSSVTSYLVILIQFELKTW